MKNLKKALKEANITQKELASKIGIKEYSLSRYNSGLSLPNAKILIKIAEELGVTIDYLFGREIVTFSSSEKDQIRKDIKNLNDKLEMVCAFDTVAVSILTDEISVNSPIRISDRTSGSRYFASTFLKPFSKPILAYVGKKMDCMSPLILPGDLLLLDLAIRKIKSGSIYAINLDGKGSIRRLWLENGSLILRSENPNYDEVRVDMDYQQLNKILIGHVVWIERRLF